VSPTIRKERTMPRPEPAIREALKTRARAAMQRRDQAREQADTEFWLTVAAELESGYFGAQADIAAALGLTRDTVLKSIKRAKARQSEQPAD
jgi:hypothetical protein